MTIPPEQVAATCRLGADEAGGLLALARAGDLSALARWTVYAAFRAHARGLPGTPEGAQKALDLTLETFSNLDLTFRRRPE